MFMLHFFLLAADEVKFATDQRKIPGFLSKCMQYGLNNHWCRHLIKHQFNMDWQCQLSLSLLILSNAYISLLSALFSSTTSEQNNITMFLRTGLSTLWDFDVVKTTRRDHALLSANAAILTSLIIFFGGTLNFFLKFIW